MSKIIHASNKKQSKAAEFKDAVVFSVDNNYLPYAVFVAHQILALEKNISVDICICIPDIKAVHSNLINSKIRFVEIDIQGLESLPVGRLSLSAYHRLFLPEILSHDYRYLIYLDADTYILRPFIDDLLNHINTIDNNFSVAAAPDICELQIKIVDKKKFKKIEKYVLNYHKFNHTYRNSGVLVFNVNNFINNDIRNTVLNFAFNNIDSLQCHDQSALNGALLSEIAFLPFVFNWQMHKLTKCFVEEFQPYILHFIGNNKPWIINNLLTQSYYNDYINFFNANIIQHRIDVLTTYERRLQNPKYSNSIKELISSQTQRVKCHLHRKSYKLDHTTALKVKKQLNSKTFNGDYLKF